MFRLGEDMDEACVNEQSGEDKLHLGVFSDSQCLRNCCHKNGFIGVFCAASFVLLVTLGVGIAKIAVGSLYLHECSAQNLIPVWLIVGGVVPLFLNIHPRDKKEESKKTFCDICVSIYRPIVSTFCFAWLVCGTVWVLQGRAIGGRCFQPPDNVTSAPPVLSSNFSVDACLSCDIFLLRFSLGMLIVEWCLTSVIFIVIVVMVARLCCVRWHSRVI